MATGRNPNHLPLATLVMLRAYQLHRADEEFSFTITVHDANERNSVDITVQHSTAQSNGALFIDAKDWYQRAEGDDRTATTTATKGAIDPRAIVKHFISYLNIDQQSATANDARYAVCTNAPSDYAADSGFNELVPADSDTLSFANVLGCKCYQLDSVNVEKLRSDIHGALLEPLGQLMASHIYHRKLITHENALFTLFAPLIRSFVERSPNKANTCYHFKPNFSRSVYNYGYDPSKWHKLHHLLCLAYRKLTEGKRDLHEGEEILIGETFFQTAPTELFCAVRINNYFADFCQQFVLVCRSSSSEASLHNKVRREMKRLSQALANTEQDTICSALEAELSEAMQHTAPIYPQCVGNALNTATLGMDRWLQIATRKYLQSLKQYCASFMVKRDRLKRTSLYTVLAGDGASRVFQYGGTRDTRLDSTIIVQTLALLPSCKGVFLDHINPEIIDHLQRMLIHPAEVVGSPLIVVTIADTLNNATLERIKRLMASNCARWKHQTTVKIILLAQSEKAPRTYPICVRDLASNCRRELFGQHEALPLFGTRTTLDAIVLPTDCLAHLQHVLDLSSDAQEQTNVNKLRYDKIKPWYIHRTLCSYFGRYEHKFLYSIAGSLKRAYFEWDKPCPVYQLDSLHHFVWLSHPSLTNVPEKKDNVCELQNTKEKMIVLLGETGAGKTAYFTWLAWRIQTDDPLLYVIHFNVAEHGTALEWLALDLPSMIDTPLIRALFRVFRLARTVRNMADRVPRPEIQTEREQTDRLAALLTFADGMVVLDEGTASKLMLTTTELVELRLFREKLNRKQVVFMLDGVDEVEPTYRPAVLQFAERVAHFDGVRKIYLSTRPQFLTSEAKLFGSCKVYVLDAFTMQDAVVLLHNLLLHRLDTYRQCDKELQIRLLPFLYCVIANSMRRCRNVPLLLYMAFILYWPALERYVDFKQQHVCSSIRMHFSDMDSFQLIATFIREKKLGASAPALLTAASASTDRHEMTSTLKRQHALFAFCTVLGKPYTDRLLTDGERAYAISLAQDGNAAMMQAGFVTANHDGMPMFSKRVYAEHFAACWLFENRSRLDNKRHAMLLWAMFAEPGFAPIRNIFNRKTIEGCEGTYCHSVLCSDSSSWSKITNIEEQLNIDQIPGKDVTGRTLLHWMSSIVLGTSYTYECTFKLVCKRLLETAQQIDGKDELFRWSALDYAFVTEQWMFMRVLFDFGAKANIDVWLDQLRSYTLVELFNRMDALEQQLMTASYGYRIIQDPVLARHVLSAVSDGVVKHIVYERDIDICRPLAELDCMSVLEHCAMRNLFSLFEHLISITDSAHQLLDDVGQRLLALAVGHGAYKIAIYIMVHCDFQSDHVRLADLGNKYIWTDVLLFTLELKSMKLFRLFFHQLCELYQYPCIKDDEIVEESCNATITTDLSTHRCLYDVIDDPCSAFVITIELVLSEALFQAKFHIISYVVQKTKLSISRRLLEEIICSNRHRALPEASRCIYNYLLARTHDLHQDGEKDRTTLLTMAARLECAVSMQCLLDKGFDSLANNALHDQAWMRNEQLAIEMFHQLLAYCSIDQFYVPDDTGYNVCENAIRSKSQNYKIARMIIHTKAYHVSTEQRVGQVLDSFMGLFENGKFEMILDFLASSHKHADDDWKDVYALICRRVPIV